MPTHRKLLSRDGLVYGGLLAAAVLIYLAIRAYGDTLSAQTTAPAEAGATFASIHVNDFLHVLLALSLVIATARLLGALFRWIHQPPVVGEMIAGIMLGPSLLGHFAPHVAGYVLPQSIAPLLNVISQFGVILYMFLVGLELDLPSLRKQAASTLMISHASIVAPFLLGSALALFLYTQLSDSAVSFTAFSLFLGVSMSVTAFPVLARILTDRRIHKTQMGTLALACAAIDDVTAWCLLAFVVSVTQARAGAAVRTILLALAYVGLMLVAIRPVAARVVRWIDARGRLSQGILAFVLLAILFSSLATESIGIHSIFGAFVLGAIIPHSSGVARELTSKLEDFVIVFLLPAFFAFTGLRTEIGLLNGWHDWLLCALIVLVASAGKFGGSAIAARTNGIGWRDASAIGVLMNTRGLMELIVLNIGLETRVISPTLFAMLVLMALITTLGTTPILNLVVPAKKLRGEADALAEAAEVSAQAKERTGVLIPLSSASGVHQILEVASLLSTREAPPRVLALNRGSVAGFGARLHEQETYTLSQSPVLAAALDAAWSRKLSITPEAVWTTDAATDIVDAAERARVRWVLLESQRSILGRYPRNGVVNRIFRMASGRAMNIAVLSPGFSPDAQAVTCILGDRTHGIAVLEFAKCLRANRSAAKLRVLFAADDENGAAVPEWLHRDASGMEAASVSTPDNPFTADHLPDGLVVIAKDIADRFAVNLNVLRSGRSVVLVQGAEAGAKLSERPAVAAKALASASA